MIRRDVKMIVEDEDCLAFVNFSRAMPTIHLWSDPCDLHLSSIARGNSTLNAQSFVRDANDDLKPR
jgi:hypothetical protein